MDIEKTSEKYTELVIMGGIDKKALDASKEDIGKEIGKVERIVKKGVYIPYVDHVGPPEVNF